MFGDNWFLFLLIVLIVFSADGDVSATETAVLLAILFALTFTAGCAPGEGSDAETAGCFCNKQGI